MKEYNSVYLKDDERIKILITKKPLDAKNKEDIINLSSYGIKGENVAYNTQIHADNIRKVNHIEDLAFNEEEADGLITDRENIPLLIFTADCVPLIFYDKNKEVVALAHAGWRGTFLDIGGKMIDTMVKDYGCKAEDIQVIIGPAISKKNYQVSLELIEKFSMLGIDNYYDKKEDGYYLDLEKINEELLKRKGITNIEKTGLCTVENNDKFYSYRQDKGTSKRIGTLIQITEKRGI